MIDWLTLGAKACALMLLCVNFTYLFTVFIDIKCTYKFLNLISEQNLEPKENMLEKNHVRENKLFHKFVFIFEQPRLGNLFSLRSPLLSYQVSCWFAHYLSIKNIVRGIKSLYNSLSLVFIRDSSADFFEVEENRITI